MNSLKSLVRAADFASRKHRDQRRKGGDVPYVNHPLEVARILADEGDVADLVTLVAAMLHDTVEDTETTPEEIEREFGARVASVVAEVTDDKSLPKVERKRTQVAHAREISTEARLVKLADKLANLRDLAVSPPPSWNAQRVQGYFVWAYHVVESLGNVNDGLWGAIQALLASELRHDGASFRATPADAEARAARLEAYYRSLERVDD